MGLIGAALGAAGSIFGGVSASKAMNKVMDNLREQQQENEDWYNRRYNEDATQRADAQRILRLTEESIAKRNRAAAATAAVMGGTNESIALEKEANNKALSDTMSQIAANADARKDAIENKFMQRKAELNGQLNNLEMQKAGAISQAVQGVTGAASKMGF